MVTMSKSFDISREGKDLRLKITLADLSVNRLARAFQVEGGSLYLKEEFGNMSFWPNDSGRFNSSNLDDGASLLVMGDDKMQDSSETPCSSQTLQSALSFTAPPTNTRSSTTFKTPVFGALKKKSAVAKIIHANMTKDGKGVQFKELNQTYVSISEDVANVEYVRSKAREAFGDDHLVLVTSNGLKVNDNDGTRGMSFWRSGARKIYAVKPTTYFSSDSDDECAAPPKKKKPNRQTADKGIQELKQEISELKDLVREVLEVNNKLAVPVALMKVIKDAFQCKICLKAPLKAPVIATKCCNSILGCEECINTWYDGVHGLTKKCPHCSEARGYAFTFQLKGIDDFIKGIHEILSHEVDDQGNV